MSRPFSTSIAGRGRLNRGGERLIRGASLSRGGAVQDVHNEAGQPTGDRAPIEARTPCDLLGLGSRDI